MWGVGTERDGFDGAEELLALAARPRPGDRWPYEPPAPDDQGGLAGDREPRVPIRPVDAAGQHAEPDEAPNGRA